ncbi:hypothetical protein PHYPSEUDO_011178 [Phytophthora pseudosyringae]|uniref:Uncharacterized protein n=1 Tax=Phytophthora pseudosyringae TaxID=221518 RepID=A0A8T1V9M0_9STRA|nr:hypothetical protein PHYPSEUDO_011178 [Phytophthora pseudosyringae]
MVKLPKITADELTASDLPPGEMDAATTARTVIKVMTGPRPRPALRRHGSSSTITIASPPVVLPATPAASPQDDRLDLLLTEIRKVASRQNLLEQQLKAMMERPQAQVVPENSGHRSDSGVIGDAFIGDHSAAKRPLRRAGQDRRRSSSHSRSLQSSRRATGPS